MTEQQNPSSDIEWLTYEQAAQRLGTDAQAVRQLVRDGGLLADTAGPAPRLPAVFVEGGEISKYLRGVINVLRDGGYSADEALQWLLREDTSLGGTPAWALKHQLHREVSRRAQALAF